jgi:hypothetical protein
MRELLSGIGFKGIKENLKGVYYGASDPDT